MGSLRKRKQGAETIVAPFSDHFAFAVRLTYPPSDQSARNTIMENEYLSFRGQHIS